MSLLEYKTLITRDVDSLAGPDDQINALAREGWVVHSCECVAFKTYSFRWVILFSRVARDLE